MRLGVIGTAGRGEHKDKITPQLWKILTFDFANRIEDIKNNNKCLFEKTLTLVSGGAAICDHLSVWAYLNGLCDRLTLYLPAKFDKKFVEGHSRMDCGRTANYYHKLFSKKVGINSFDDLTKAQEKGAYFNINLGGFHARNIQVARNVDFLIAYTFGDGDHPSDGGTAHTWGICKAPKLHVSINSLLTKAE